MADTFIVLPFDTKDPLYLAYQQAFDEFCKYEEGTCPPEVKRKVTEAYKTWVKSSTKK
jgi:hypothetical protein